MSTYRGTSEMTTKLFTEDLNDYRQAPSNSGPLAAQWHDKPHRLLYDLCNEVERLQTEGNERLGVLLKYKGVLEAEMIQTWFPNRRRDITAEMDAIAEACGFEINWLHDSRDIRQIVADDAPESAQAALLTRCDKLDDLEQREKELWEALNG